MTGIGSSSDHPHGDLATIGDQERTKHRDHIRNTPKRVGAIGALSNLVNIARYFRTDPPLDQKYASKVELADLERRIDRDSVTFRDSLKEIFGQLRTINHSLGRLEGRNEKGD